MVKKILLLIIFFFNFNSFAQQNRQEGPILAVPPPVGCGVIYQLDTNNDGFASFNIQLCKNFVRAYALSQGFDLSGYAIGFESTFGVAITTPTYTNAFINEEACFVNFTYLGTGIQYNEAIITNRFGCYKFTVVNPNANIDQDGVLNSNEDLNNNLFLMDDNTDADDKVNVSDNDDDNDGILTINEDYNGNGNLLDDDMNLNGIPDYLDFSARGSLNLNLKLFIEGYYSSASTMQSAKFNQDGVSPLTDVETITVELHNATAPYTLVASSTAILKTNGNATCLFPTASVGSYYIAVKSRNGIQTWSATTQSISNVAITYNFSDAANKAYGNNMKNLGGGVFGFYSGDINQDESIDGTDAPDLFNDINNSEFGVRLTDLNGDGSVDNTDIPLYENNQSFSIFSIHP